MTNFAAATARLSAAEVQQYVQSNLIPNFRAMLEQDIYSTLYDRDGRVIMSTNKSAISTGFSCWQESVGKSYADATPELISRLIGPSANRHMQRILTACKKIHALLMAAIEQRRVVNYIDLIPYNNKFKSYRETFLPHFHPNGEVIAVQSITSEYNMFKFTDFLTDVDERLELKALAIPNEEPPIQLPQRQHEILYLILQGIPQEFAAQILNIKRGTLARIISEQICPKFKIHGSNTKLLVEKAMRMGFHRFMPKSLWVPGIIILDQDLAMQINQAVLVNQAVA